MAVNPDSMPDDPKVLARIRRLAQRREKADAAAAKARDALYAEMQRARLSGEASLSGMARELRVSRQRVQKIMDQIERG